MKSCGTTFAVIGVLGWLGGAEAQERFYMDSLYSRGGIELRLDERIFSLLCVMNIMGYDEALVRRGDPVPAYVVHPLRMKMKLALGPLRGAWDAQFQAFFDKHPRRFSEYLDYVLTLSPPPELKAGAKQSELAGFEELLGTFHRAAGLSEVFAAERAALKTELKGMLTVLDGKIQQAIDFMKLSEEEEAAGKRIVFVYSALLAQGEVFEFDLDDYYLVVGPALSGSPVDGLPLPYLRAVVKQLAERLNEPAKKEIEKIYAYVKRDSGVAARYRDSGSFALDSLSRAIAEKLYGSAEAMCVAGSDEPAHKAMLNMLARPLADSLEAYEKSGRPLKEYVSEMFSSMKAEKIIAAFEHEQAKQGKK